MIYMYNFLFDSFIQYIYGEIESLFFLQEQIIKNNTQSLPQDIVFIFKNWLRKLSIGHFSVGQQLKVVNKLQIRKRRKSNRKVHI